MPHILAIDAGTTGVTSLVFDEGLRVRGRAYQEFPQHYPEPGLVEHDADDIWQAAQATWQAALLDAGIAARDVAAIGITNQRETTVLWDRETSDPVHPAIVWQDRRTAGRCRSLKKMERSVRAKTGLVLDAYFSATKLEWLLQNVDGAADRAAAGDLAFGTVDAWLLWKLTAGASHGTDVTNASRTMLWDIHQGRWDSELCSLFGVPDAVLPAVRPSGHEHGRTDAGVFGAEVPITGIAGDQQAALFGQRCFKAGQAKNTYGTGCFLLQHTGEQPVRSRKGLLTTRAASLDATPQYALEGSVFVGGAAVQWFRDGLHLIKKAPEIDKLAASVDDAGGVVVVPAFTGLGAPHWDPDARGAALGITRGTSREHMARAVLEGIAHQCVDVLDLMEKESRKKIKALRVDGGLARSDPLMQAQADLFGRPVERAADVEATAMGAAMLAGISQGLWTEDGMRKAAKPERTFKPKAKRGDVRAARRRWQAAVKAVRAFGS